MRQEEQPHQRRRWGWLTSALPGVVIGGGLLLGSCQTAPTDQISPGLTVVPTPQVSVPVVDLERPIRVTRRWKLVFVSQDGPKGHENISPEDCPDVVWCHMWQRAAQTARELGVDLELAYVREPCTQERDCISQQIRLLDQLIQRGGIDGLIVAPRDSNLLVPVIETAIANNIAVISTATPINSEQVLTFVTFNDQAGGQAIGKWVAQQLQGDGNVVIIEGPKYQQNALDRRYGFITGLQGTNINVLDTETALWTCKKAQTVTQKWLAKYTNIDAIIAASDHMALGALIATQQAGRDGILITGYDAIPSVKAAILQGALGATIEQFPRTPSPAAVQLLVRHLETGETFPPVVYLPKPNLIDRAKMKRLDLPASSRFNINTIHCDS